MAHSLLDVIQAGLLSAVVSAFLAPWFQLLLPAPTDDIIAALAQISSQLTAFSVNPGGLLINSTHPAYGAATGRSAPSSAVSTSYHTAINFFWLGSLACTLIAAFMGLWNKLWLGRYYRKHLGAIPRQSIHRLQKITWWYSSTIYILLYSALFLFMAGIFTFAVSIEAITLRACIVIAILIGLLLLYLVGDWAAWLFVTHRYKRRSPNSSHRHALFPYSLPANARRYILSNTSTDKLGSWDAGMPLWQRHLATSDIGNAVTAFLATLDHNWIHDSARVFGSDRIHLLNYYTDIGAAMTWNYGGGADSGRWPTRALKGYIVLMHHVLRATTVATGGRDLGTIETATCMALPELLRTEWDLFHTDELSTFAHTLAVLWTEAGDFQLSIDACNALRYVIISTEPVVETNFGLGTLEVGRFRS